MQFDMSKAWQDTTGLLSANREVILIVAGVFFFLPYVAMMLMIPDAATVLPQGSEADPEAAGRMVLEFYASVWWLVLIVVTLQAIGMLGLLALLTDHRRPTLGEALKFGGYGLFPYLGAQIIESLVIMIGLGVPVGLAVASQSGLAITLTAILAFVALCYVMTKFSLVPPVMAKERVLNPVTALIRSWQLTKGNSFRIFLFYVLLLIAAFVVTIVTTLFSDFVFALLGEQAVLFGTALVSSLMNAAMVALFMGVLAATHRQLTGSSVSGIDETFS